MIRYPFRPFSREKEKRFLSIPELWRLGAEGRIAGFTPPPNLWDTLGQGGAAREGVGRKEQFDQMEKSTAGLLAGIAEAKKKAYQLP